MAEGEFSVKEDNTKKVLAGLKSGIEGALEKIGLTAEGYAKQACPVDTGRLRNSITHEVDGKDVYIGTNVEYAPYVELGTSTHKKQPFLKPAAQDHADQYRTILKDALSN